MKASLLILFFGIAFTTTAQLQFSEIGTDPAYCRMFGYQSGNGVVFAQAEGGTPPYTYQWKDLSNGQTTSNTTWGGLNPGDYQIIVWDDVNDSIFQTVVLDSVDPHASFDVVSSGLSPQGNDLYWGEASVDVDFVNTTTGVGNVFNQLDTAFFWSLTQFQLPYLVISMATQSFTYDYGGTWGVSLVAINKNGCRDTARAHIWLNGTAELEEHENANKTWFSQDQVNLQLENSAEYDLEIVDLNGKVLIEEKFFGLNNIVEFKQPQGVYIVRVRKGYELILNDKVFVR
jgi:hypothetical protein